MLKVLLEWRSPGNRFSDLFGCTVVYYNSITPASRNGTFSGRCLLVFVFCGSATYKNCHGSVCTTSLRLPWWWPQIFWCCQATVWQQWSVRICGLRGRKYVFFNVTTSERRIALRLIVLICLPARLSLCLIYYPCLLLIMMCILFWSFLLFVSDIYIL